MTCRDCRVQLHLGIAMEIKGEPMIICAPCWRKLTIPEKLQLAKQEHERLGGNWQDSARNIWASRV